MVNQSGTCRSSRATAGTTCASGRPVTRSSATPGSRSLKSQNSCSLIWAARCGWPRSFSAPLGGGPHEYLVDVHVLRLGHGEHDHPSDVVGSKSVGRLV